MSGDADFRMIEVLKEIEGTEDISGEMLWKPKNLKWCISSVEHSPYDALKTVLVTYLSTVCPPLLKDDIHSGYTLHLY